MLPRLVAQPGPVVARCNGIGHTPADPGTGPAGMNMPGIDLPGGGRGPAAPGVTRFHFVSGLPGAGAMTLLRLLAQNPAFRTGADTPAPGLFAAVERRLADPGSPEARLDAAQGAALLRGVMNAVHHDRPPGATVFDCAPNWLLHVDRLAGLFPLSRFVVLVRDAGDLAPGGQAGDSDADCLRRALGAALGGPAAERVLVIERRRLLGDPLTVMDVLYHRLGAAEFDHDFTTLGPAGDG